MAKKFVEDNETVQHGDYLSSLENVTAYICGINNDPEAPKKCPYRFCTHQWFLRFPHCKGVVNQFAENWKNRAKDSFVDFEDLYETVKQLKVKYFGNTCIYDFALRYGWNQTPRIEPKANVYVHAKPYQSAKHLKELGLIPAVDTCLPLSNYRILADEGLSARDIEHFLCCYHGPIMALGKETPKSIQPIIPNHC